MTLYIVKCIFYAESYFIVFLIAIKFNIIRAGLTKCNANSFIYTYQLNKIFRTIIDFSCKLSN